jgi:2'-5' RNA ligase
MARDRASRPEARPLRLFIAVDVPDAVKAELAEKIGPFRERIRGARWTKEDGWHVTLKFLGATWPRLMEQVSGAVEEAARSATPFQTRLTALGVFATPRRARVVWAGLDDPDHRFAAIVGALDGLLSEDFEPEKREFTPHLTLARLNPPRDIREFAPEIVGMEIPSADFEVQRLVLYRSHLSPHGAKYEPLLARPLGVP